MGHVENVLDGCVGAKFVEKYETVKATHAPIEGHGVMLARRTHHADEVWLARIWVYDTKEIVLVQKLPRGECFYTCHQLVQ